MEWHLRSISPSDRDFLYALHVTTMREVIEKTWGWDEAWQQTDFERRLAAYIVSIIEAEGRAAGSVWLEWKPDSLYIHEVQILPDFQGKLYERPGFEVTKVEPPFIRMRYQARLRGL